jgi:hypothetical protein
MMLGRAGGFVGGCSDVVDTRSHDPPKTNINFFHIPKKWSMPVGLILFRLMTEFNQSFGMFWITSFRMIGMILMMRYHFIR